MTHGLYINRLSRILLCCVQADTPDVFRFITGTRGGYSAGLLTFNTGPGALIFSRSRVTNKDSNRERVRERIEYHGGGGVEQLLSRPLHEKYNYRS